MERVKITLPEQFYFSTILPIRISDINYGNHVGNDAFLSLMHEARIQFLSAYGFSEMDVMGVGLIMADVAVEYKKELHYGDAVRISVAATGFDRIGFDLHYLLEIVGKDEVAIAGKAKTGMMCFDYKLGKRATMPNEAIQKLQTSAF